MNKTELEQKLASIESRLDAFGDVGTKLAEIDGYVNRARDNANEANKLRDEVNTLKIGVEESKAVVDQVKDIASFDQATIAAQSGENKKLSEQLVLLQSEINSLKKEAQNQLGTISAEVLSNAFEKVALDLKKSLMFWRNAVFLATALLALATGLVVWWELESSSQISLTDSNFLLKLTLTSPFIFSVIFVTRQYSREKKLFDEYTFKSAVALSFEAFRKLLKEEDSESDHSEIVKFMIMCVTSIYSSPMDNLAKNKHEDEDAAAITALGIPSSIKTADNK